MANARDVLDLSVREAALLAHSEGTLEQITPLLDLARDALAAGDGDIPDQQVRDSGLHPAKLSQLGL